MAKSGGASTGEQGCKAKGCEGRHYGKGYCKRHYAQVLRHGRLTPERERGVPRVCEAKGCGRTDTLGGYCRKHARQMKVHGRLTPELERKQGGGKGKPARKTVKSGKR